MARSETRSRREYNNPATGEPVLCPHCGTTTRRIPRRPLDRVVNVLWDLVSGMRAVRPGRLVNAMEGEAWSDDYPDVTTAEAAARIGISTVRMTQLCRRGQVSGALRFGRAWMVPADFEWERHNTGPKPKRDALNSKLSRVSAKRAGSSTAASESAAALITTTESFGPGCPVLDGPAE